MFRFTTIASLSIFLLAQAAMAQTTDFSVGVGGGPGCATCLCNASAPTSVYTSCTATGGCPDILYGWASASSSPGTLSNHARSSVSGGIGCGQGGIVGFSEQTIPYTISGPTPTVNGSLRMDYEGTWSYSWSGHPMENYMGTRVYLRLWSIQTVGPQYCVLRHNSTGISYPYGNSLNASITSSGPASYLVSGSISTPTVSFPTNTTLYVTCSYLSQAIIENNPGSASSTSFGHMWPPCSGPVFNLPPGYTADCPLWNVVNNQWVGGVTVTDVTAQAYLNQLTQVAQSVQMQSVADRPTLIATGLTSIGGNLDVTGNATLTALNTNLLNNVTGNATISDNPVLGNVVLPGLTQLGGGLTVVNNTAVTTIDFSALGGVGGGVTVTDNPGATTIDFSALGGVGEGVTVTDNPGATTIDFSALGGVGGGVTVTDNPGATTIDFSALGGVGEGVTVTDNPGATTIDFSALGGVGGGVTVTDNPGATSVHLGGLSNVDGSVTISNHLLLGSVALPSLTQVGGGLTVVNNTAATTIDFDALDGIGGDMTISDNPNAGTINFDALSGIGGDMTISDNPNAGTIDFDALSGIGGDMTISDNPNASTIDLGALGGIGGDMTVTDNPNASTIDLGALGGIGGDMTVTDNPDATEIVLDSLTDVGGDLTIETQGQSDVDLSGVDVVGDIDVSSDDADAVEVAAPGGTTSVEMCNDAACMDADLPDDAAPAGTPFAVLHVDSLAPVPGQDASGDPAVVDPVAAYAFALGAPLQGAASLVFDLTLASLSPEEQTAVLDAYVAGLLTLTVQSDAPGSVPQARAQCAPADPLVADGCVKVGAFDALGFQLPPGETAGAATLRIAALVSHFSTYSVAIVTPLGAGDCNCSGAVTLDDVPAFVLALLDADAYAAQYPGCPIGLANANADGAVDGLDVQSFVNMLVAP